MTLGNILLENIISTAIEIEWEVAATYDRAAREVEEPDLKKTRCSDKAR